MTDMSAKNAFKVSRVKQYDLFTNFYGSEESLSNTIELWDHTPKYFVTEEQQASLRTAEGFLPILKRNFKVHGVQWSMEIQPALLEVDGQQRAFYPSFSEEIVEDALRKIFNQDEYGVYDHSQGKSWVRFSLKKIARELKKYGSTRSIDEIKHSLDVMAGSSIKPLRDYKEIHTTQVITSLTRVGRQDYIDDSDSRWACRLPDLLSEAINTGKYRQYNYALSMSFKSQLSRWLHKRLSHNYTQAFSGGFYNILLSTMQRDSGLLEKGDMKSRRRKVERALNELGDSDVIKSYDMQPIKEGRKIIDIKYYLFASDSFIQEMKAANKRKFDTEKTITEIKTEVLIEP